MTPASTQPLPFEGPPVLTVAQVNQRAKQLLERQYANVRVLGEISNLRQVGGHYYFTLKDDQAHLSAALFRGNAARLKMAPRDGLEVVAVGRLTIYVPRGSYQIVVDALEPRGAGALQAAFEELKRRLADEGLFDQARKRPLPLLPRRVAVITSPTGAVIRDIIQVATRRLPTAQLLLVPTRVQGAEAAPQLVTALAQVAAEAGRLGIDVVIVARGGGSLEDLWCFNDEAVARAIAQSPVPVVSAVGHETDFTIADFVADLRAPTPSAAAELVFPSREVLLGELGNLLARAGRGLQREVSHARLRLRAARAALGDGRAVLATAQQRLDLASVALAQRAEQQVRRRRLVLLQCETRLARLHPEVRLGQVRQGLTHLRQRLALAVEGRLARERTRLVGRHERLVALSPLGVLERGYSIVMAPDGRAVRRADQVQPGEKIEVRVARGELTARVETVEVDDGN